MAAAAHDAVDIWGFGMTSVRFICGTHEHHGMMDRIDILTGTLGKALGDAALASRMADAMLEEGVYVVGFSYPVVPHGKARIRTQVAADHSRQNLEQVIAAFEAVRRRGPREASPTG